MYIFNGLDSTPVTCHVTDIARQPIRSKVDVCLMDQRFSGYDRCTPRDFDLNHGTREIMHWGAIIYNRPPSSSSPSTYHFPSAFALSLTLPHAHAAPAIFIVGHFREVPITRVKTAKLTSNTVRQANQQTSPDSTSGITPARPYQTDHIRTLSVSPHRTFSYPSVSFALYLDRHY